MDKSLTRENLSENSAFVELEDRTKPHISRVMTLYKSAGTSVDTCSREIAANTASPDLEASLVIIAELTLLTADKSRGWRSTNFDDSFWASALMGLRGQTDDNAVGQLLVQGYWLLYQDQLINLTQAARLLFGYPKGKGLDAAHYARLYNMLFGVNQQFRVFVNPNIDNPRKAKCVLESEVESFIVREGFLKINRHKRTKAK